MSKKLLFKTFCIEQYKAAHELNGKETIDLFDLYEVLSYLDECYEPLHTQGSRYLVEEVDELIKERKAGAVS